MIFMKKQEKGIRKTCKEEELDIKKDLEECKIRCNK